MQQLISKIINTMMLVVLLSVRRVDFRLCQNQWVQLDISRMRNFLQLRFLLAALLKNNKSHGRKRKNSAISRLLANMFNPMIFKLGELVVHHSSVFLVVLLREKEILSASLKINHIMQMVFIMSD
jgi:hypothetical protein